MDISAKGQSSMTLTVSKQADGTGEIQNSMQIPQGYLDLDKQTDKEFSYVPLDASKEFTSMPVDVQKEFFYVPLDAQKEFFYIPLDAEKDFSHT